MSGTKSNSLGSGPPKGAPARDKAMGVRHIRERAALDRKHARDHRAAAAKASGATKTYHQKKAASHAKELKKDVKALAKRKGS